MDKWRERIEIICPSCGSTREVVYRGRDYSKIPCRPCSLKGKNNWTKSHGESSSPLYAVWSAMKQRCTLPSNESYSRYGGRGIQVCKEWGEYAPFREWANRCGYRQGLLLDRIDNDGNYEPSNCKWSTSPQSAENRSTTKLHPDDIRMIRELSSAGESNKDIADFYGVTDSTISDIKLCLTWRHV